MKNFSFKQHLKNNYISISLKTLFNKENIYFYWVPRILISFFIIIVFEKFHMPNESNLAPLNPFEITDEYSYSVKNSFNPLFSIIFQFLNQSSLGHYAKVIFGQIVSSLGTIIIIDVFFKNIDRKNCRNLWRRISKLITGLHPYLALYAMKFGTENFTILGLAIFVNIIDKKNSLLKNNFFNSFLLYILTFVRSQLLPLFFIDIFLKINKYRKSLRKNIFNKKQKFTSKFLPIILVLVLVISINFIIKINSEYIQVINKIFKNNEYLITAYDLREFFCNYTNCNNLIINFTNQILSIASYLLISIIMITGARGRLTDMPWELNLFGLKINSLKSIENGYHSIDLLNNFNQTYFILIVVLPLIIFSTFHIIGFVKWFLIMKDIDLKLSLYILSLLIIPILFFPYMRYFIPLITFSCIGIALPIMNLYLKINSNVK